MTTTTTRTYAFCPMLLALCRDRSFVATCQGGEQHDIHARLARDSARPAGARARLLRRVDGVPRVHRPRRVLPQRHRASLRHSLRSRRKCHVPLHRPDPTRQTPLTCRRPVRTQRTLSETRVGSGRVRSVEFGLKSTNCYRTDSHQRPHRCCHPSNRVEFIDRFFCGLLEGRCHGNHFFVQFTQSFS